jgi:hypothetical protein
MLMAMEKEALFRRIHPYLDPLRLAVGPENHELDRIRSIASLPDRQAVDTILRYAASNERELTRATRLLLLLQSSRRATELNSAKRSQELV